MLQVPPINNCEVGWRRKHVQYYQDDEGKYKLQAIHSNIRMHCLVTNSFKSARGHDSHVALDASNMFTAPALVRTSALAEPQICHWPFWNLKYERPLPSFQFFYTQTPHRGQLDEHSAQRCLCHAVIVDGESLASKKNVWNRVNTHVRRGWFLSDPLQVWIPTYT